MLVATEIDTGGIPTPAITLNARCFQQFIYFSYFLWGLGRMRNQYLESEFYFQEPSDYERMARE